MKTLKHVSIAVMILTSLLILVLTLGTTALAETHGVLTYTVENEEIIITDCIDSATKVDIPAEINGYPVTVIGNEAFRNCTSLTSVTIPDSVKEIGDYAFAGCSALTELIVPESVKTLGGWVFNGCVAMTDIYLYYPYCDAPDADEEMLENITTIHGHSESSIEAFANQFGFNFEEMHIPESEWISTATCVDAGIRYHECKYCDEQLDVEEVSATGAHVYEEEVITAATCIEKGEKTFNCSVCEDSYTEEIAIDADNHAGETEIRDAVAETCGDAGYTGDTYCLACEKMIKQGEEVQASGIHNYVETVTTPATCIAKGIKTSACTDCETTFQEPVDIDPDNHAGATVVRDVVTETCLKDGYTGDTYCIDCGEKIANGEVIPATGKHNYAKANTKTANCYEEGEWTYICSSCGDFYIEKIAIDSRNHEGGEDVRDVKDATCAKDGYTGDTYCLGCSIILKKGAVVPATGEHDYVSEETKASTCIEKGVETFTCSVCEDSYTEEIEIDADNHVGETEIRDAVAETCGEAGYTGNKYCLDCEKIIEIGSEIAATGDHTNTSEVTKVATCCEKGIKTHTCSVCGNVETEEIEFDAENHVGGTAIRDVATETCGKNGYTGDTYCLGCDVTLEEGSVIPATNNHNYASAITKSATCYETGVVTYICSVCSNFYTESIEINKFNHAGGLGIRNDFKETCAAEGYTGDTYCLGCNETLKPGTIIEATGIHTYEDKVTTPATCIVTGVRTFTCSVCEASYTEAIEVDADNHAGETEIRDYIEETCGKAGYSGDKYCLDCEKMIEQGEEVSATGIHDYVDTVTTPATCIATGVKTFNCSVCEASYTEEIAIDADNHAGETEIRDDKAETCGDAGYTGDTYCLDCEKMIEQGKEIPATGIHAYVDTVTTPATCIATGVRTFTCSVCEDSYTEEIAIDADNHAGETEIRDDKSETCVDAGYSGDKYCLDCEKMIEQGKDVPATGIHTYNDKVITAATCISKGEKICTCTVCEYSYTAEIEIDANNHVGETEIRDYIEETCGDEGYTGNKYCLDCEKIIEDGGIIPATGNHTYESKVTTAATCCATGVRTYTCTVCAEAYASVIDIDATNHIGETEIRDVVAETCGTKGHTGNTYCKGCNVILAEGEEIPATGEHTYIGMVTKVATCIETGITTYTCYVCADAYDETTEKNADNHVGETEIRDVKTETCGDAGYTGNKYCLACENIIEKGEEIPATGEHTYESEITTAATCCEKGVRTYTCSECGHIATEDVELDADNHVGETEIRNAVKETCITDGYTGDTHCKSCDAILETGTEISLTGMHTYESEITKAATCCEEGVRTYTCMVCSDTFNETIAKNTENHAGETEVRDSKTATCSATGYTGDTYCKDCDAKIAEGTDIAKTAHTEVKVEGKAATCSSTGLTAGTKCSVCSAVITAQKTIAKIDHRYGEWSVVKEPTVSEEGSEERICEACGKKDTRSIEKLSYIIGDVNGDGKITAADARLALRISANIDTMESVNTMLEAVDMNLDKKITAADARAILRKSANLE